MMKDSLQNRAGALAALILAAVASSSCPERTAGEYVNKDRGFKIAFPAGWEIKEAAMGLDAGAFSPLEGPSDQFRDNVTVASSAMKAPLTGDQVLDENLPTMLKILTDFQPGDRGTEEIGGLTASWIIYTHRQGQYRLKVKLYAVAGQERAFLIHCTAETDAFVRFEGPFGGIAQSFKVIP